MAPTPQAQARFQARLENYDGQRTQIRNGLLALIVRFFRGMSNPYDPPQVATYSKQVADATRRAQIAQANLAIAQQRLLLADEKVKLAQFTFTLPQQPRGVDPVDVAQRAAREFRITDSQLKNRLADDRVAQLRQKLANARLEADQVGRSDRAMIEALERQFRSAEQAERDLGEQLSRMSVEEIARERGLRRALVMATDDVQLAEREGNRQAFEHAPAVILGWRRTLHPELSRSGSCGLCVASSTRRYSRGDLLPVHSHCFCTCSPIIEGKDDLGDHQNQIDLGMLYKLAGSTSAKDLSKVRYRVDEHGELGGLLVGDSRASDPAAVIAGIDQTLKGLGVWAEKRGTDVDLEKATNAQLDARSSAAGNAQ